MPTSHRRNLRAKKAEVTRLAILEAARKLFAQKGYAAASIASLARAAGVSIQTLYDSVGGKAEVLTALQQFIDDAGQVGSLNQKIRASKDAREVLRLLAQLRRGMMEGAGDIFRTLLAAKDSSREVAKMWEAGQQLTRRGTERAARKLAALQALRPGLSVAEASDVLYALLAPQLYLRLLDDCGWAHARIETWLDDSLARLLL